MSVIRVVVADDHPVVRSGIRALLDKVEDIVVVGEAADGATALHLAADLAPDVLLLDMELPGLTGLEVAREIQAAGAAVRVLALSAYDDEQYIFGLLASGAAGYLTKDEAPTTIVNAVRGVARGEGGWLSRRITAKVLQQRAGGRRPLPEDAAALSARERQVLGLLARGQANAGIAAALSLSEGTVKNHVTNLYAKLAVHTRAEAVAWAWQQGLVGGAGDNAP